MKNNYTLYIHTCPNGKVYIGITSQEPKKRWDNGRGYKNNEYFTKAILKYGWDNIQHDILYTGLSTEEAAEKEKELIKQYNSNKRNYGYNFADGGFNNLMYENTKLPPMQEILASAFKTKMFIGLLEMCLPNEVKETTTVIDYDNLGNEATKKIVAKVRKIEPNIVALNMILDNYEDEKILKGVIEKLKKIRNIYDE